MRGDHARGEDADDRRHLPDDPVAGRAAREIGHALRIVRLLLEQRRIADEHHIAGEVAEPEPGVQRKLREMAPQHHRVHDEAQVDDDGGEGDEPQRREHRHQRQRRELRATGVGEQGHAERLRRGEAGFRHRDAGDETPSEDAGRERQQLAHAAPERGTRRHGRDAGGAGRRGRRSVGGGRVRQGRARGP